MKKLSYKNVFSEYNESLSDKFIQFIYLQYKKIRLYLSKFYPIKGYEKVHFEGHRFGYDASSTDMPIGYNYIEHKDEEGFINLKYIDLYDYLPKEDLAIFKKQLDKFVIKNKLALFSTHYDKSYNFFNKFEAYDDFISFSNLVSAIICHNDYLNKNTAQVSISLINLSSSFLVVNYKFYISDEFNKLLNKICKTKYSAFSKPFKLINMPWYRPYRYGVSGYAGNDVRSEELYHFISKFKWNAFNELRRYFTIHFEQDNLFPPTFETYCTNIRPKKSFENRMFWDSIMLKGHLDYSIEYNACVNFKYKKFQYEGTSLSAYCGGVYSKTSLSPEAIQHDISDIYAVFVTADSMARVAKRNLAEYNKNISNAIHSLKILKILKVRVNLERKLYYSYRFISEFSGNTIDYRPTKNFIGYMNKRNSATESYLKNILKSTKTTKEKIDSILKILNDAADAGSEKSNIKIQWVMLVITLLSLIVAFISLFDIDVCSIMRNFFDIKTM